MKSTDTPLLLGAVSPDVRKLLVRARCRAMRGAFKDAVEALGKAVAVQPPGADAEAVVLGMARAELHHLHREDSIAVDVITSVVLPRCDRLPELARFVVEGNLATAKMGDSVVDGVDEFYQLVDRRRQLGFDWIDYPEVVAARDAVDAGRPADAIQPLWQEVIRSYRQGYWQASRWAEARYARLCLDLGELEEAAYHFVVGEADKQIALLGEAVVARRDAELIRSTVRRLLGCAHLRRHFVVAAEFVARVHDVLPDDLLPEVARWLLPRCREVDQSDTGKRIVPVAWNALRQIGDRLPPELAAEGVKAAIEHPIWSAPVSPGRVILDRDDIVKAVTHLCHRVPPKLLPQLAADALPLALDRAQDADYPAVINLLINLSARAGGDTKQRVSDALYPEGQRPNRLLAQVDRFFGKESLTPEQLAEFATGVAAEIRLQVQHVKPGEQPVRLPETLATYGAVAGGGGPIVTLGQGLGLAAIQRHLDRLPPESLGEVVRAMLAALQDPDNLPPNRVTLLGQLVEFAARVEEPLRGEVFTVAEALYSAGTALGPAPEVPRRSAFSGFHGDPDDVRAMALVCGAAYAVGGEERMSRIGDFIEQAAVDPSAKVRRGSYGAARRLPDLPPDAVLPLLMGLRDPDAGTAVTAFSAFAERLEWKLTRPNWRLFLLAVQSAADSPHTNLRRHAALAAVRRAGSVPSGIRREWAALIQRFAGDVSSDVRGASQLETPKEG